MADKGWVRNREGGTWDLMGSRGEVLRRVPMSYVAQAGAGLVNLSNARPDRCWPMLRPECPPVHCILTGPGGVEHQFVDGEPPPYLVVRGRVYRPAVHCGHLDCPRHYRAAEHAC